MILFTIDEAGTERRWNEETQMYTEKNAAGEITVSWAFLPGEVPLADARAASEILVSNELTLRNQALAELTTLLSGIEALKVIYNKANNQITAADTKDVARETRKVARQLVRITRLVLRALDSTDTGSPQ